VILTPRPGKKVSPRDINPDVSLVHPPSPIAINAVAEVRFFVTEDSGSAVPVVQKRAETLQTQV
jgi:hypothetical protein